MLKTLYHIANSTRLWVEQQCEENSDLMGMCAVASCELFNRLQERNISPTLHIAIHDYEAHVFVVAENYIIDVTATQFGVTDKIVVRPNQNFTILNWYWRSSRTFNSVAELIQYQQQTHWPNDQIYTV